MNTLKIILSNKKYILIVTPKLILICSNHNSKYINSKINSYTYSLLLKSKFVKVDIKINNIEYLTCCKYDVYKVKPSNHNYGIKYDEIKLIKCVNSDNNIRICSELFIDFWYNTRKDINLFYYSKNTNLEILKDFNKFLHYNNKLWYSTFLDGSQ